LKYIKNELNAKINSSSNKDIEFLKNTMLEVEKKLENEKREV
jgi:hypothetical protein